MFCIWFPQLCSLWLDSQYVTIGSSNGLASSRRQAITWIEDHKILRCRMVLLDDNELIQLYHLCMYYFQLLLAKDLETVLALSTVCTNSNDRTPLATSLLQIFRHERQESHLLKTLNDLDIDNEGE